MEIIWPYRVKCKVSGSELRNHLLKSRVRLQYPRAWWKDLLVYNWSPSKRDDSIELLQRDKVPGFSMSCIAKIISEGDKSTLLLFITPMYGPALLPLVLLPIIFIVLFFVTTYGNDAQSAWVRLFVFCGMATFMMGFMTIYNLVMKRKFFKVIVNSINDCYDASKVKQEVSDIKTEKAHEEK